MISSTDDLKNYNIVMVLYPSGSSGEFLGHALVSSFDDFAVPGHHWEKDSRMKFNDCFGRSFNGADESVTEATILKRFNQYLEYNDIKKDNVLVGLSHPHAGSMDFISNKLTHAWVLEVTTRNLDSQKFRDMAATEKIGPKNRHTHLYKDARQEFAKHLKIEWKDLFLTRPQQEYQNIANFFQRTGNFHKFKQVLNDYLQRNQHIIDKL